MPVVTFGRSLLFLVRGVFKWRLLKLPVVFSATTVPCEHLQGSSKPKKSNKVAG